jgi:HK97 family phage prohead protease
MSRWQIASKTETFGPELLRIGVGGVVPVQWEAEKSGDPGTLTGWASVYSVVDQQDDIVMPGAFKRTMDQWRASKGQRPIPLTLDHQNTAEGVIGSLSDFQDSSYGLKTTFRFSSTQKAQDARANAREGHLNGLSIYGPIFQKALDTMGGKTVRVLKEVGLAFVGLTPMPANTDSLVLTAKAVSDKPWAQFTAADYTPEQWARACLIDTGEGDTSSKARYKLPVKEPDGTVSRAGAHAAASVLGGGRGGVQASSEQKTAAAKKLVAIYRNDLDEDPPESLLRMAGMASSALLTLPDSWVTDMRSALGITIPEARDAAVGVLVKAQYGAVLAPQPEPVEEPDPAGASGASDDCGAAEYALAVIGESGPGESPPGGDPSDSSLDGLLASVDLMDATSITSDLNALEAELRSVSSDHADASEGSR